MTTITGTAVQAATISDAAGTGPATLTGQIAAKAWSNLNGTGTIAERASFNISGYVDNGTGDYTFTLSANMNNINYMTSGGAGSVTTTLACVVQSISTHVPIVSATRVETPYVNASVGDMPYVSITIHGDLA